MQTTGLDDSGLEPLLHRFVQRAERFMDLMEASLPAQVQQPDWNASIAFRYRKRATGHGCIEPILNLARIDVSDLKEIEPQKARILQNTLQFVKGMPANNVLLTGARGTGKSSLVRACLYAHAMQGLRLIEVDKSDLVDLPDLVSLIAGRDEKYLIFCDDLSFDDGEPGYKALKSALDGSLSATTSNVLVYATSNRRHLLPEYMQENLSHGAAESGEIHPGEGVEEKISLSERFGVWISFYPFSQDEYLAVVAQWLSSFGLDTMAIDHARPQALVWALDRGSRSGRVAWQFARDFAGKNLADK
jgi:predicted AAA+ superfamily ATPase